MDANTVPLEPCLEAQSPAYRTRIEPSNLGDLLKYEASSLYSREVIMVEQGQFLVLGTVVAKNSQTGFYKALDPLAKDYNEAIGILLGNIDTVEKVEKAVIVARHAIVSDHAVVWQKMTDKQKEIATKQLEARGILIRKGV